MDLRAIEGSESRFLAYVEALVGVNPGWGTPTRCSEIRSRSHVAVQLWAAAML
jgi:hypothetical protein